MDGNESPGNNSCDELNRISLNIPAIYIWRLRCYAQQKMYSYNHKSVPYYRAILHVKDDIPSESLLIEKKYNLSYMYIYAKSRYIFRIRNKHR